MFGRKISKSYIYIPRYRYRRKLKVNKALIIKPKLLAPSGRSHCEFVLGPRSQHLQALGEACGPGRRSLPLDNQNQNLRNMPVLKNNEEWRMDMLCPDTYKVKYRHPVWKEHAEFIHCLALDSVGQYVVELWRIVSFMLQNLLPDVWDLLVESTPWLKDPQKVPPRS